MSTNQHSLTANAMLLPKYVPRQVVLASPILGGHYSCLHSNWPHTLGGRQQETKTYEERKQLAEAKSLSFTRPSINA